MELENTWLIEHQNKINHRWWWPETKLLQWWPETSCSISGPELSCYNSLTLSDSCPTSHHSQIHAYVDSNEVRSLSMMSPVSKMVMSIYYINPRLFRPCLIDTIGVFNSVWDNCRYFPMQSLKICTCKLFVTCNPRLAGSGCSPCCCKTTALLQYFKPVNSHLPDLIGPLSANIPLPAIHQTNLDVLLAERWNASMKSRARGPCSRLTNKQRAQIGKSVRLLPQWRRSCHVGYILISRFHTRFIASSALHML